MGSDYFVYIMGNHHLTLYIGSTNNVIKRVWEHKRGLVKGFTKKYKCQILLYYEVHKQAIQAVTRERQIKKWEREWKLNLIRSINPSYSDLYSKLIESC